MSLIYEYLQQLKKKKENGKPSPLQNKNAPSRGTKPGERGKRTPGLLLITSAILVGLGIVALLLVREGYLQSLLHPYTPSPPPPQVTSRKLIERLDRAMNPATHTSHSMHNCSKTNTSISSRAQTQYGIFIDNLKQEAKKRLKQALEEERKKRKAEARGYKKKRAQAQGRKNSLTQSFHQHFMSLSRRNQEILNIQKALQGVVMEGDLHEARRLLASLAQLLGRDDPLILKWKGVIALKQKHYEKAEKIFLKVISISPDDSGAYVNLILAFTGEHKMELARRYYTIFKRRFPDSPLISRLDELF